MAKEKEEKTFEESLKELENLVKELESGEADLDKVIEKYSEAMKLAKLCGDKLTKATEEVNKILKENGTLENFEIPEE
ncbi:MAG: exodeoxyribonuclease VII small subunit [Firmicutes bacterium]|jgi:exodeoxyribonuclease VII small subunit|nr:exodeoxyribonuclease VII small subunit [Bacillota bacterium]